MEFRSLFDLDPSVIYFNAAYVTPLLKKSKEAGVAAIEKRQKPWELTPDCFFNDCERLRGLIANLWNVSQENIALVPSVSYGAETAVKNIPIPKGSIVLMSQGEFPSDVYPWMRAAREQNAEIKFVKREPEETWLDAFSKAFQTFQDRVSVVSCSVCDWSCGASYHVEQLRQWTRKVGAALVVDASQSFGAVPIDVRSIDPDFLFSVGYKWQLGPYGVSYLYVSDPYLQGRPLEETWLGRANCKEFSKLTAYSDHYLPGARRFDSGQKSQFNLLPMAITAAETLTEIGLTTINSYLSQLTGFLTEELGQLGFRVCPRKEQLGHMIGFSGNQQNIESLLNALKEKNVRISCRNPFLRVSPHIYNTMEEAGLFVNVLKSIL